MKKKKFVYITLILSGLLLLFSCNQDAIFFKISQETAPIKPLIPGSPTNMVEFKNIMYVASGNTLHWYSHGAWDGGAGRIPQPRGWISGLAATSDNLYALRFFLGPEIQLFRFDGVWQEVNRQAGEYTILQTIYADPTLGSTRLFAGARINSPTEERYGILYLDDSNTLQLLKDNIGLLYGAASDSTTHYLSTTTGVYKINENDITDSSKVAQIREGTFVGMLKINNKIIVVERNGSIFEVTSGGLIYRVSTDNTATGALALWTGGGRTMLTAGIQKSNASYGYVEFNVDSDNLPVGSPSDPSITVDGLTDRYHASLGKYPINHMHQASLDVDSGMRFFASTVNQGLWSYRNRVGGPQWNAED